MKVSVSCSGKFHAFALCEQLQKQKMLADFYTAYAWQRNRLMRRFAGRVDKEVISPELIHTNIPLAVILKATRFNFVSNDWFDRWVAWNLTWQRHYDVFIGWSGMSLRAIRTAKSYGKIAIVERGSSHILYQNAILQEEYNKMGIKFSIDPRVIEKELKEYEICDYISIPSTFVKNSFLEHGVKPEKLALNPYGAGRIFQPARLERTDDTFRILYLGALTVRKGLKYLFEALKMLQIPDTNLEVWFIGGIAPDIKPEIERFRHPFWKFHGHIPQHELPQLISRCDVAIQPSLEEGLSMVIPQILGCGVPVIATTNTGGMDIIREGVTGFIVPIRSPQAIAEKIMWLYQHPERLAAMKSQATESVREGFTWNDYGMRYVSFLKNIV